MEHNTVHILIRYYPSYSTDIYYQYSDTIKYCLACHNNYLVLKQRVLQLESEHNTTNK